MKVTSHEGCHPYEVSTRRSPPTPKHRRAEEARDAELAFLLYAILKQLTDDAVKTPAALPLRRCDPIN